MKTVLKRKLPKNISLNKLKTQSDGMFDDKILLIRSLILNSVNKGEIQKIYLFGSYAYGKPNESSDIDICVIIKDSSNRPKTHLTITMNLTDNGISPCDLVVCRESDFYNSGNPNGIEHTIMEKGRLLYAC
jgi:predicted nucleotidyltransferase